MSNIERNPLEIKTPKELFTYVVERNLETTVMDMIFDNQIGFKFCQVDGKLISWDDKMYFTDTMGRKLRLL